LSNLRIGIPVFVRFDNGQATVVSFKMFATTPGGTAYTIDQKLSGAASGDMGVTGIAPAGNSSYFLSGPTYPLGGVPTLDLGVF
jgi:hypothetical protein